MSNLKQRSFENLVLFSEDVLRYVDKHRHYPDGITKSFKRRLCRHGVTKKRRNSRLGSIVTLTQKTKEVLGLT